MKIITRQSLANEAAAKWAEQYKDFHGYPDKFDKGEALKKLHKPVNPDEVDRITGNTSWTTPNSCNVCNKRNGPVVEVGEEEDCDSRTAWVCFDCVKKVAELAANFKEE